MKRMRMFWNLWNLIWTNMKLNQSLLILKWINKVGPMMNKFIIQKYKI